MARERGHQTAGPPRAVDVVTDMVDDDPALTSARQTAATLLEMPSPAPLRADRSDKNGFPWGWLIKHPGYGAMRIRRDQARSTDEAIEVYRQARCPHLERKLLDETGLRVGALDFRPADTERGK